MPDAAPTVPPEACVRCAQDADYEIAALWLCVDCYHTAGSTCAGIGAVGRGVGPGDQVC